ncbi:MAG: methylated-DNA--[protein]-cysteine S-methyltransferase [Bacteroidota bacterium]|nr:methylated-DNA--[protein]-cysteine S-methyltransferase [Bacteroidota bacterium]MDP3146875.1 methylated-DNA--[protein]-cysteine S-methyltransferase [Bacteroidota bacterium]
MESILYNYYNSPLGEIELAANNDALLWVKFLETQKATKPKQTETESFLFKKTIEQFDLYFKKDLEVFDLPLAIHGTEFQKNVWQKLTLIPYSKTINYLTLAKQIGDVNATRAVASSNGKNRFCIIIPCHRVIGSDCSLTGYAGDIWRKKWLLEHETRNKNYQTDLFL